MNLERFVGGDPSARAKLNALVDTLNACFPLVGDGIVTTARTQHGTAVGISIEQLTARMPKFGMRLARAVAPDVRTESGSDAPAWIRDGTLPYVYGWPTNFADGADPPPALSSSTASQFVKVYLPGSGGQEANVRGGDVFTYYTSEERNWIGPGGWYDDPLYTKKEWVEPVTDANATIRKGWHLMNDDDVVKIPSVDVDTDGVAMDLDGAGKMQDLRQRTPWGSGDNPDVANNLVLGAPLTAGELMLEVFPTSAPANEFEWGFYSTHHIVRVN